MDDDLIRSFDQSAALLADNLPPFWHRMYTKLRETGFDEPQALGILKTYIFASNGGKMEK